MGKTYDHIPPDLRRFIESQQMFFVATAPPTPDGHVNVSPKGLDSFRVLDEHTVAYLDLTGSGNETSAHLDADGRVTFMFCAFEGKPMICRLYGRGRTVLPESPEFAELSPHFPQYPGSRQFIVANITRVMTSCGFAVPRYEYVEQRPELIRYSEKLGEAGMEEYRRKKNLHSIDGIVTPLGKRAGATRAGASS